MDKRTLILIVACLFVVNVFSIENNVNTEKYYADSVKSSDGTPISFESKGSGDITLLFVHGWLCDKSFWKNQIDPFSKNFRYVAMDMAGHGKSGKRKDYTLKLSSDDVKAVVDKIEASRVILIGHSWAGAVIAEAARLLGTKVVALIGIDNYQDVSQRIPPEKVESYIAPVRADFKEYTRRYVGTMFPENADSNLVEYLKNTMSSADSAVGINTLENYFRYDPSLAIKELKIPIRAIISDLWPYNLEGNQKAYPDFNFRVMKGYGNFIPLENPGEFNKLLFETIDEVLKTNR